NNFGNEIPIEPFGDLFTLCKKVPLNGLTFDELQALNIPNHEGYIVRFDNGHRVKIKFADYLRLHKIKEDIKGKFAEKCILQKVENIDMNYTFENYNSFWEER
ncbi:hypothetical protein RZS08_02400, partial [Arthrospira platensis SPKY1]|nr:hypothetical protein [Arthrospira platensis SPKY1]